MGARSRSPQLGAQLGAQVHVCPLNRGVSSEIGVCVSSSEIGGMCMYTWETSYIGNSGACLSLL